MSFDPVRDVRQVVPFVGWRAVSAMPVGLGCFGLSDTRSAAAAIYRAWYRAPEWRNLRSNQLDRHPICRLCAVMGKQTPADTVNHIKPHRGDASLFFDPANLESLCKVHHDSTIQRHERGRLTVAVGQDGWPVP